MASRKNLSFILLLLCQSIAWPLYSQNDISRFTKYTTLDGLNHNHVTSITQDSIGYMWIGTENGPMRFDGSSFVGLTSLNPEYAGKEPFTVKITTLGNDEIGISTLFGAFVINTKSYELHHLHFEVDPDLTTWAYNTFDVSRDSAGYYGVSSKTGFYVFDLHKKLFASKHIYSAKDVGTTWMLYGREIVITPGGQMLQKNDQGTNLFDTTEKKIRADHGFPFNNDVVLEDDELHFNYIDDNLLVFFSPYFDNVYLVNCMKEEIRAFPLPSSMNRNLNWFSKIIVQNDSTLLINGKIGLYKFHIDKDKEQITPDTTLCLPNLEVSALHVDRDGRLWIGTYLGLYKENISPAVERFPLSRDEKKDSYQVRWMEKVGNSWYASTLKDGLLVLDEHDYHVKQHYPVTILGERPRIGKLFRYDADHLWACTSAGLLEFDLRSGMYTIVQFSNQPGYRPEAFVGEIYEDQQGIIWITGNEGNTVYRYDRAADKLDKIEYSEDNPKFKVNIVYRFNEDGHGNIWFCGDAMARYNPVLGKVDSLIEKLPLQLNSRKVFLVYRNTQNHLWFATNGENWHIYEDGKGFSIFEDARLSPDLNKYHSIIGDQLVYVSRQGKIISLNTISRKSRILSATDGWDQELLVSLGFFKDPANGHVIFAGDNVIYRFQPEPISNHETLKPFISEINIVGKNLIPHPGDKLVFNPDERTMHIKFKTLNFDDPRNQLYAYRLKGDAETAWINIEQREIILTQIPSGRYELELRVSSKNNDWPPAIASYPILIRFPFYLQPWFIATIVAMAILLIWFFIQTRMRRLRFISNLDKQVIEYELKALHAQMNPHFVFNCLNSIKEMIMSKDNKNANIYLNKFSYLLRSTLDQSKLHFVPLAHTIEYLRHYLEMEKLRFTRFHYSIEVQEGLETDSIVMAPLLLQPIVENAIWHGQERDKDTNQLIIRFYSQEDNLVCEVEDFGIGINASKKTSSNGSHMSSALENIRKRIELLNRKHDVDYRLVLEDKGDTGSGQGTIVKLFFKHMEYEFD